MSHFLETLPGYRNNSVPAGQVFRTHTQLSDKITPEGSFKPFPGNTVVFLLSDDIKPALQEIQNHLYHNAGDMFSDRLHKNTFHMTLHSLCDAPADRLPENFYETMHEAGLQAAKLLEKWQKEPAIEMRTTCTFNLVNTSVVLGLEACDSRTGQRLAEMYEQLQKIVYLPHPLLPHITLAYYRPGVYSAVQAKRLADTLGKVDMPIVLSAKNLTVQIFLNMNNYITEFCCSDSMDK